MLLNIKKGLYTLYHQNNNKWMEYTIKNGKYSGISRSFYSNGQLQKECYYINGKLNGKYQLWDIAGKLCIDLIYRNDVRISSI
jgi:antitoxin component YwqK of YwqJK toxin-antitoxin module